MRSRQALSSPQYYSRALSPPLSPRKLPRAMAGQPTAPSSEEVGQGTQDQSGSSSDVRGGNETSSVGNSHGSLNGIETTARTPPENSSSGGTGPQGDHAAVEVAGGKDDGSTDSRTMQVDAESGSRSSRRTRTRRRVQAAGCEEAALETDPASQKTKSGATSSQELKSESARTAQRTGSEDERFQRITPETDTHTPQESKSETNSVGRDGPDSSQEDSSGGRRYIMSCV